MNGLGEPIGRGAWDFDPGLIYLNHGSFGPSPRSVKEARAAWYERLERDPVRFFQRELDGLLDEALERLAGWLGSPADCLAFVPNSTVGMNVVASSVPLGAGDEVLLSDHEYGAVDRLWTQACAARGARKVVAPLPRVMESKQEIVEALWEKVTPRTRLIVLSHITSPTALLLPVEQVCRRARAMQIAVCIDGAHGLASLPVDLEAIGCDYWVASAHKWLSAPMGSGLIYVRREHHDQLRPAVISWGRSQSGRTNTWKDELHWFGTFDPSAYLATTAALDFLERAGWERFWAETHELARRARQRLAESIGAEPLTPDAADWYRSMVALRLPGVPGAGLQVGRPHPLQARLFERFRIEVPIYGWQQDTLIRVSCHAYNPSDHVDRLVEALEELASA